VSNLVLSESVGAIATITLNRPERLNAMTAELLEDALAALEAVASDDSTRIVILTGAGRGFCVGGDLAAGLEGINGPPPLASQQNRLRRFMRTADLLHRMPQITIAAINGACAGAGLAWACACDLRFASSSAVFNTAFLTAGVSGDFGGTWTLPRIVGPARARELYLTCKRFDADEAQRFGLVSEVCATDDLMPKVRAVAMRLAGMAPLALERVKRNLNDSEWLSFSDHLDTEAARHAYCCSTKDAAEAAAAFFERREPVYRGE
jgi:2-(1,2-epoxy-1,2-dihydrophenyl)acetyl-CoA isomerase